MSDVNVCECGHGKGAHLHGTDRPFLSFCLACPCMGFKGMVDGAPGPSSSAPRTPTVDKTFDLLLAHYVTALWSRDGCDPEDRERLDRDVRVTRHALDYHIEELHTAATRGREPVTEAEVSRYESVAGPGPSRADMRAGLNDFVNTRSGQRPSVPECVGCGGRAPCDCNEAGE